jgi:hypothetical protein
MTQPPPAEQSAALAALSGMELDPGARRDVAYVLMIAEAQRRGITWRQIASALGCENGPAAKRAAKRLARSAQSAMLRGAAAREVAADGVRIPSHTP